jgi:poly-gamma-glutamate synthesis protein (capsule biosynthesis protein)
MRSARTVVAAACLLVVAACAEEASAPTEEQDSPSPTATRVRTATPSPSPTPVTISPLTLADVFPPRDLSQYKLDPTRLRTVIATGDVIPARYTDFTIRNQGDDFLYPVRATSDITKAADVTVINLEAPLVDYCPIHTEGFTFCGRPGFVAALQTAGVDVATLENNHIGNYGQPGVDETVRHLEAGAIKWADRDSPAIVDVRGLKFGFLGVGAVGEVVDRNAMAAQIKALRPQVDVLAVGVHWGAEYVSLPQSAGGVALDNPVELAHLMVDSGADLVIGNHPHWVQAVELYKGKYIAYAHGNFIFDQMWSYQTRIGVIGKYTFYDDHLVAVEYIPTLIENYAQPVLLAGAERQAVLDGMKAASEQLVSP